jgi:CHAT domain-containing protein/tetratricopeptide (TPR) repeat protein
MRRLVAALLLASMPPAIVAADPPAKPTADERQQLAAAERDQTRIGGQHHEAGRWADAAEAFEKALDASRRLHPGNNHANLALCLNNLAGVYYLQGRYADAEDLFREALRMIRRLHPGKKGHPDVARGLNNLATVVQSRGNHAEAETLCREALDMNRDLYRGKDHLLLANSLLILAVVLKDRGKHADAEPLCRESLAMLRRLYPADNADVARNLNNLAAILLDREQWTEAETVGREALAMRRRLHPGQDHPDLISSLNNLAYALREQGKYADATGLYGGALEMCRRVHGSQDNPVVAATFNNLAFLHYLTGKYDGAERMFRDALDMSSRLHAGQDHATRAQGLSNLAFVLQARGRHPEAEPLYRDSLRMYRALAAAYAAVRPEGDALTLAASYPPARDLFLSNSRVLGADANEVYAEVWSSKAAVSRVYERRALAARAAAANPRAASLLAQITDHRRRRADVLLAAVPGDPATLKKRDDALAEHAHAIDTLERQLRRLLPAAGRAEKLAQAGPADLQKALPAATVLVDFLRYTRVEHDAAKPGRAGERRTVCYLAFVITRDQIIRVELGPAGPIEDAVAAWREAITSGKDISHPVPLKVRELVWDRVRKGMPDGVKAVYVSPDLALCRVPWAALPGDRPGTMLLEVYAVAVVPHAAFLLDKLWPQDAPPGRASEALVVGGVAYDTDIRVTNGPDLDAPPLRPGHASPWPLLDATAAEAKGVAAAAASRKVGVRALEAERASPAAVLSALPQARFAHLATHGFFADRSFRSAFQVDPRLFVVTERGERVGAAALSPLVMTGLVLAGANRPRTPGRGIMTGEALVDVDLSGLELAVLSACETGLGDLAGGEGTFGLQRAFHQAGARDVVASLWKVPDRPTAALMALFYRNLWEKDLAPVEALRQAQLAIYREPDRIAELADGFRGKFTEVPGRSEAASVSPDGKAHPRLWAAFTLSGPGR